MALKDWKQINDYTYRNKINGNYLSIVEDIWGGKKYGYNVFIRKNNDDLINTKPFETKRESLIFAKKYMRSH